MSLHGTTPETALDGAPRALPAWAGATLRTVGAPVQRASAVAKVTGQAEYPSDVTLPGMVHAVLVRSTVAHGQVTHFDARAAQAVPGVLAVAGPQDGPWPPYPPRERPCVDSTARFVGEEIGVVVAATEQAARHAARQIVVTYATQPACVDLEQALGPMSLGEPVTQTQLPLAELIERGDLPAARAAATLTVDSDFSTEAQCHNPLEPHGCVAAWEGEHLTLWDGNQGGHLIREWLARALGMAPQQVHVHSRFVGGGFGSKITLKPYHLIAADMARRLGRPVRLFMARREEFVASHQRAATRRHIALGATADGTLAFIDEQIAGQAGPCNFLAPSAAGAANGLRLHRTQAVRAQIRRVRTHAQAPTPFRGPAAAEDIFCLEQAVDELAHRLGMDPLALRQHNLAETDKLSGLPFASTALARCYRLGAEAFGWQHRACASRVENGRAFGIGLGAAAYDGTLYEKSQAQLHCVEGGHFVLHVGVSDMGCGVDTVFAQIAAEELQVPVDQVRTVFGDTDRTPRSIDSSNHSRTSAVVGPSVRAAAHHLKRMLLSAAARHWQCAEHQLTLGAAGVCLPGKEGALPLSELVALHGPFCATGAREQPPDGVSVAMFAAHFVEVAVELATGRVQVLRAVCAHDAGRLLNPRLATGQVHGGFLQGMGMALQEHKIVDPRTGMQLNATMWAYKTPGILDAPGEIRLVDAGVPDGGNSLGVKGIGEPPLIAAGAAIANAIHNAIGVRLRAYPITPAKVLAALQEARA